MLASLEENYFSFRFVDKMFPMTWPHFYMTWKAKANASEHSPVAVSEKKSHEYICYLLKYRVVSTQMQPINGLNHQP